MSKRREVQKRISTLNDIDGILTAMKSLALLEIRTLTGFLEAQRRVVASMEAAAGHFLAFHGKDMQMARPRVELLVLVGSERGFCGDFNEQLLDALKTRAPGNFTLIAVGRRLDAGLENDARRMAQVEGATVAAEIHPTLERLSAQLASLHRGPEKAPLRLSALYHCDETRQVRMRQLLPLAELPAGKPASPYPPRLYLTPPEFYAELTDHYLHAVLYEIFYSSLMVENRRRLEHMDSAIRRLEKNQDTLRLKYNGLRQEEIIEEIEILMLSADALTPAET
ncbi:MAG: F0F1 ATP synthase subunit gamma [Sulfuricella denitrificans]|nr:F0F1 ATP synthase subunit gamma [Sulfuricella denitrificans]